jgi:hypothetical protein
MPIEWKPIIVEYEFMLELVACLIMLRSHAKRSISQRPRSSRATRQHLTDWKLARFRKSKLIPYVPLGHRTYLYNVDKVRAALNRLEVKEVA